MQDDKTRKGVPDRDGVIRILQNIYHNADLGADLIAAAGWALALIKEQEPVEPDSILTYPVCGVCHEPLDVTDEYCRHCGRAVKWRV